MKKVYMFLSMIAFSATTLLAQNVYQGKAVPNAPTKTIVNSNPQGTQIYSPNLNGTGNGHHCLSDHLMDHYMDDNGIRNQIMNEINIMNLQAQQAGLMNGQRITYTLPIVFHVVYNPNNPAENVSNASIIALFNRLNQDFTASNSDITNARAPFVPANVDVNFCLAMRDNLNQPMTEIGVHRVSTTEDYYDPNTESNKMKASVANGGTGADSWDRTKFINVWICDITNGASSGTAGYAYRPTTSSLPPSNIDGIVVDYNLGMPVANRVLTHEMGHFLGLAHTWGNSNSGGGCSMDDGLTDTPQTAGPSFNFAGSCSGNQQTCPPTQTQYENFMDYSSCQVMFTSQQAALMIAVIGSSRLSLTTSNACTAVNPAPPVADFSASITTFVAGGSTNFTDLSTNYPTSWAWTVAPSAGVTYIGATTSASQNPVIQFANAGTYTVTLVATNSMGSDTEIKTNYITVVASGGGTIACDTLRNYTPAEEANMTAYGITGEVGTYPGTCKLNSGTLNVLEIAEKFTVAAPTQIRGVYMPFYQIDDMGTANNISFKIYSHNAGTGLPNASLGTAHTMTLANINEGYWNEIQFTTPISVSGTFWVSVTMTYPATFDTIVFATTDFADRVGGAGTGTAAAFISGGVNWQLTSAIFNGNPNTSIIMDALTSNGPAPVASLSMNPTTFCATTDVNLNGYASTNTGSYLWYFDDGTNLYYSDQGNLNTNFSAGPWSIELNAQGSCMTSTVTQNITVNPSVSASYTTAPENCVASDGNLVFTASGGDGTGYTYSINNGATFQGSNTFTGLQAGTYNVVIDDGSNCTLEAIATVTNQNTFAPGITSNQTITSGQNVNLTVTGGTTWSWFEGTINIGTTATVNVAPTVTTTYYCYVVDANGCEANLTVTVTVLPNGVEELGMLQNLVVYPNPSSGMFTISGNFAGSYNLKMDVRNLLGQTIHTQNWPASNSFNQRVDLSALAEGIYILSFMIEDKVHTVKVNIVR